MPIAFPERILAARAGTHPALICRVSSGWVVLGDQQFLRGYTILLADPVVASINDLDHSHRKAYLCDMVMIGDAILEVTGAYRINYGVLGNTDPYLHAHIVPRYLTELDRYRKGLPWSYPKKLAGSVPFDRDRDKLLSEQIARAIQKRM
jgi:diadenosine tetraphosphate (Ap4A) HIT family hydrolase